MPSQNQITTLPLPSNDGLRVSDPADLLEAFPASPVLNQEEGLDAEALSEFGNKKLLNGKVHGGYGLNHHDRDYGAAPDLSGATAVDPDGHNTIRDDWTPNTVSPGSGVNASSIPAVADPIEEPGVEFGSGIGHLASPKITSANISQTKIGDYLSGAAFER